MIGLSVVMETEQILQNYHEKDQVKNLLKDSEEVIIDHFDFDQSTFADFIDYIDFQGYEQYVFFVLGHSDRILRIVSFLQNELETTSFHVIDSRLRVHYGDQSISELFKKGLDESAVYVPAIASTYWRNGLMSMFTGVYPEQLNKNILKHVYVQNSSILEEISRDVFLNMAINSSIYINQPKAGIINHIPVIVLDQDMAGSFHLEDLIKLRKEEVLAMIERFKENGIVENEFSKKGIFDYSLLVDRHTNNRLFYYEDGIYHDYLKEHLITKQLSSSYFDIFPKFLPAYSSSIKYDQIVKSIFPLMFHLASYFQLPKSRFITPYSNINFEPIKDKVVEMSFIGIENEKGSFVFRLKDQKMYETNQLFLKIMEADQKGRLEDLMNQFDDQKAKEILEEYREIVNHA
jgi:hypothetical protein